MIGSSYANQKRIKAKKENRPLRGARSKQNTSVLDFTAKKQKNLIVKPGWLYYTNDISTFFLSSKKLFRPGQIIGEDLIFDRESVYVEIISLNCPKRLGTVFQGSPPNGPHTGDSKGSDGSEGSAGCDSPGPELRSNNEAARSCECSLFSGVPSEHSQAAQLPRTPKTSFFLSSRKIENRIPLFSIFRSYAACSFQLGDFRCMAATRPACLRRRAY
jgi:hypothetical protein